MTQWTAVWRASLYVTVFRSLLKFVSIELVILSNHVILCPALYFCLQSFPASGSFPKSTLFESGTCVLSCFSHFQFFVTPWTEVRWPKYWSFNFSISPSNKYSGFTSFRTDWLDLRAVQGTLKSLLQQPLIRKNQFFGAQFFTVHLSHPYMTGKNTALTIWTFVVKVISLLFTMLSRFVIAFLPRSKPLLISWLQSQSLLILEPKKIKYVTASTFPPSFAMK